MVLGHKEEEEENDDDNDDAGAIVCVRDTADATVIDLHSSLELDARRVCIRLQSA